MAEYRNNIDYKQRDPERKDPDPYMIWNGDVVSLLVGRFNEQGDPIPQPEPMKPLYGMTMRELATKDIPPVRWIVKGLISEGVTFLSAPPKTGKTWFGLDIALSAAKGQNVLGFETNKCGTIYFALDDNEGRFQSRLNSFYKGKEIPPNALIYFECERFGAGLIERLNQFVYYKPNTGLVVFDTFQMIRPPKNKSGSDYEQDYSVLSELRRFAYENHIAIVLIHHNRKDAGAMVKTDPFDSILGSTALQGACDNMIVIKRNRAEPDGAAVLYSTSKDADEQEIALHFNKSTYQWENVGDLEAYNQQQLRNEYDRSPAVAWIKEQIRRGSGKYEAKVREMRDSIGEDTGETIGTSERDFGAMLKRYNVFFAQDGIRHEARDTTRKGDRGKYHIFTEV